MIILKRGINNEYEKTLVNEISHGKVTVNGGLLGYYKWGTDIGLEKDFNKKSEEIHRIDYYI